MLSKSKDKKNSRKIVNYYKKNLIHIIKIKKYKKTYFKRNLNWLKLRFSQHNKK